MRATGRLLPRLAILRFIRRAELTPTHNKRELTRFRNKCVRADLGQYCLIRDLSQLMWLKKINEKVLPDSQWIQDSYNFCWSHGEFVRFTIQWTIQFVYKGYRADVNSHNLLPKWTQLHNKGFPSVGSLYIYNRNENTNVGTKLTSQSELIRFVIKMN